MDTLARDNQTYIISVRPVTTHVLLVQEHTTPHVRSVMLGHSLSLDNVSNQVSTQYTLIKLTDLFISSVTAI